MKDQETPSVDGKPNKSRLESISIWRDLLLKNSICKSLNKNKKTALPRKLVVTNAKNVFSIRIRRNFKDGTMQRHNQPLTTISRASAGITFALLSNFRFQSKGYANV
jgi:hypothetical protein